MLQMKTDGCGWRLGVSVVQNLDYFSLISMGPRADVLCSRYGESLEAQHRVGL